MKLSQLITATTPRPWSGMSALQALQLCKLPAKVAYRVVKNSRLIDQELAQHDEARQKLLGQYGATIPEEGAKEYNFPEGKKEEFSAAYVAMLEVETELPVLLSSIDELGSQEIEPWILAALDGICFKE